MAGTRRSTRQAAANSGSNEVPSQSKPVAAAGTKRKAESEAPAKGKRGKKGAKKEQTTIEESMPSDDKNGDSKEDVEMKDEQEAEPAETSNGKAGADEVAQREKEVRDQEPMDGEKNEEPSEKPEPETNGDVKVKEEPKKNGFDALMDRSGNDENKNITKEGTGSKVSEAENAVEDSSKREEATPSNILEKGLIYFFFRGRVGINEPGDVNDVARSYIVLRPIPQGAKLGDGPIGDAGNNRILALPKKVLPVSPKDRFLTFVEKANISMDDIKSQLSSSDYATKTAGVRHTPAATPIGEGVYAITETGRETHLAYILTIPSELGEVQQVRTLYRRPCPLLEAKRGNILYTRSRKILSCPGSSHHLIENCLLFWDSACEV